MALVKPREEMSLIEIINDRHSGMVAPSEIEKKKKKQEEKRMKKEMKKEEPVITKPEPKVAKVEERNVK